MRIKRINYNKVCRDKSFDPSYLKYAVGEALNILEREENSYLSIKDLRTLNDYIYRIWGNQEIYIEE